VSNISGTSNPYYADSNSKTESSWIKTYKEKTGSSRTMCSALECGANASHGAHVRDNDNRKSQSWAIIPTCASHNHPSNTDPYHLKGDVIMMEVNINNRV